MTRNFLFFSLGLKKTCVTMDQERPRSDLSINSRNHLRKVLHLEFLYKENKAKENPLKTNLELITRYFLDHFGNIGNNVTQETSIPALSVPSRSSETALINIYDLADEDESWRTSLSEISKTRQDSLDGDVLGHFVSSKRSSHKSRPIKTVPGEGPPVASAWEKMDKLPMSEPSLDMKRVGEKVRPKSGLIVRGMMAGPVASSPQDSLRRRLLRRSPALSSAAQPHKEGSPQEPELSTHTSSCPSPPEGPASSTASTSRSPRGPLSELARERRRTSPGSPPHLPGKELPPRGSGRWGGLSKDSPAMDGGSEANKTASKFSLSNGNVPMTQERLEGAFERQRSPPPSLSFCCFNEEWKLQSFSFNDSVSLKYGIVQNKGGPCGVLAAVQGCVLQKLLFEADSSSGCARLQPSNARRTHCLALAIADIVWRAGGRERAVVTLGVLRTSLVGDFKELILHSLTCYEELVTFLQQSIHQAGLGWPGPLGCASTGGEPYVRLLSVRWGRTQPGYSQVEVGGKHGREEALRGMAPSSQAVPDIFPDPVGAFRPICLPGLSFQCRHFALWPSMAWQLEFDEIILINLSLTLPLDTPSFPKPQVCIGGPSYGFPGNLVFPISIESLSHPSFFKLLAILSFLSYFLSCWKYFTRTISLNLHNSLMRMVPVWIWNQREPPGFPVGGLQVV
ncbi:hypothetical protein FD754_018813 [Muntiacus muntjak]|uniref:Ubiquitin carboxyl-terminal hydrolase MINDY n=1 Tax=Muntiacus muntjak TaxID=9888 RepID=A0A5N3UYK3_MUNMU|nr:hypothetical protein FD754_018813 [Muntiacus muntjak]